MESEDAIIYSLVARRSSDAAGIFKVVVLSEYTTTTGNFQLIAHKICEKLPQGDTKSSYTYDTHIFHILIEGGVIFICMTKATDPPRRRIPFAFLVDVQLRFKERYSSRYSTVSASECYEPFALILRARMEHYSKPGVVVDKVSAVQAEISEVKDAMSTNIETLIHRGEKLDLLVHKTDELQSEAQTFKRRTNELKNKMWWRNCKMTLLIALPVICGLFWVIFWLCGGISFCNCGAKCLSSGGSSSSSTPSSPSRNLLFFHNNNNNNGDSMMTMMFDFLLRND